MTQNKKRKQSPIYSDRQYHDGKMFDDHDENIESVLFDEMTRVNSKLISLGNNFKLVDNLYFVSNGGMIDEFIGNMKQFLKELENHRKDLAFKNLNSDILSHVYQFLDSNTLINCCGLVCKLWRKSLIGLRVAVTLKNIHNFSNSSLINYVTALKLVDFDDTFIAISVQSFKSLSICKNLNQLKVLDLSCNTLSKDSIEYLMKCNMPNLTELNLDDARIAEKDVIELFNSNLMKTVKKLELSEVLNDFTNSFYESVSESKYLNQITHLKIYHEPQIGRRIDLLLKDKIYLEHLEVNYYDLSICPNLFINGIYKNLKYLDISSCQIKNEEFVNLLVSPNLPKLNIVIANYMNDSWNNEIDQTIAIFPSNSQSSITELELRDFNPEVFPSLIDHCPKLKRLTILPLLYTENSEKVFTNMMKSPSLANLDFLDISYDALVEDIFINPIYSNLKVLNIANIYERIDKVKRLSNCTNLVNLTTLNLRGVYVKRSLIEELSKAIHNNPTFSKLKHITFPECGWLRNA